MKLKIALKAVMAVILLIFAWHEVANAFATFVDGSQIRRCRSLDDIDVGPVFDIFHACSLVETTSPPAASISDVTITTELDFYLTGHDILERWTIPGEETIERFYEYGVNGYSQWYGPCATGFGDCYFGPSEARLREVFDGYRSPFTKENLGVWKYEEFRGGEILTEIEFEMKELVLTEVGTGSRIGIVNQDVERPFTFKLATFEDSPESPYPVAGERVSATLAGPRGQKGAAVYGLGAGSKTNSQGLDSATIRLGSKPGIYTLKLDTRWMVTQPTFDFFAIDDIRDLDPAQEHTDTEQGVGEGKGKACDQAGNPIRLSIGNKFQKEVDLEKIGISPIEFIRYHNSLGFVSASFGNYWTHSYDRYLEIPADPGTDTVKIVRPDGRKIHFSWDGGSYKASPGIYATLEQAGGGWVFTNEDMTTEIFDIDGFLTEIRDLSGLVQSASYDNNDKLIRIESNAGQSLDFAYDSNGRLSLVTDQSGRAWAYEYEILGRLHSMQRPDGALRVYHYEDLRHPYALTGITDERGIRFSTYEYDESGLAIASYHAGGADRVDVEYKPNGERIVLDPLGNATVYQTRIENRTGILDGISGPICSQGCGLSDTQFSYDSAFNITGRTTYGVTTLYGNHDSKGQPAFRIEAAGSPDELRMEYEYDPRFRNRTTRVSEPSVFSGRQKITDRIFNPAGKIISETVTGYDPSGHSVSRTIHNTYNGPFGQITLHDGPSTDLSDITRYEYYPDSAAEGFNRGRLKAVVDANGIRTRDQIQYTNTGKIQSESRPNGVVIEYSYYAGNDRIQSMTQSAGGLFNRTQWEYTSAGDVSMIIIDDETGEEVISRMFHDDARRLYKTQSRVSRTFTEYGYTYTADQWETYEFDGAGNITSETRASADLPGEDIVIQRVFDAYSRIDRISNGGVTKDYNYSPNGTLESSIDGNSNTTVYTYDDFKRLTQTAQMGQVSTEVTYDVHGNTASVSDPENHTTRYHYDDLGNLLQQDSPDTGSTVNTFSSSGQLLESVDAKGQSSVYEYDAAGRLTGIDREGTGYDITYSYDVCPNGLGRLCSITTGWGHVIQYGWNPLGEMISFKSNEGEIGYSYGPDGILDSITYPSGRVVRIQNDGGVPSGVSLLLPDQPEITLVEDIRYSPLRRPVSWRFGNGLQTSMDLDERHRPVSIESGDVWSWQVSAYDLNDNPLGLNTTFDSTAFSYDALNRLTAAITPEVSTSFGYDKVGNRISMESNGQIETGSFESSSNRLLSFGDEQYSLDMNGNTVAVMKAQLPERTYQYSSHNRLLAVVEGETSSTLATYQYDGTGQRVTETTSSGIRKFVYGQNGELMAVLDGTGTVLHEYVYLNGMLIADLYEIPGGGSPENRSEIIVDNDETKVTVTGKNWSIKTHPAAVNGSYLQNRKTSGREVRWFVDEPGFPGGSYDVYVKWLKSPEEGTQTKYRVLRVGNDGLVYWKIVTVKHADLEAGDWAFLGNYLFRETPGNSYYQGVQLKGDDNKGGFTGTYLQADAVKFVPARDPKTLINLRYIHTDHLGTPHVVTNDSGEVVWTARYRPFGEAAVDEDPDGDLENYEMNIRFPGQYYNEESGLHYNYFRDYNPRNGRYIESDPIGLEGGLNTFVYVQNGPGKFVDPLGLMISGEWINDPKANFTSYGLTGLDLVSPYVDEWGYVKVLSISGFASGFVNIDVRCSDSSCAAQDWEIHERIEFSYSGSKDFGPNGVAVGVGVSAGPLAGTATGILTFGGSSLGALLSLLQDAEALGADKVQRLYAIGPDAICKGFR